MASAGLVMVQQHFRSLFENRLAYIDEILGLNYEMPKVIYDQIFNMRTSTRMAEEITGLAGLGRFAEKPQSEPLQYDRILAAYDVRFTHKTFAKGYQISMELNEDEIDGVLVDVMPELGRMAKISIEADAVSDLPNGFGTVTAPDGVAFFGTHVLSAGGTFSNLLQTDFSQSALEAAINQAADMVNERGELMVIPMTRLVIPNELRWIVSEVLESQQRSDTANNAINVVNRLGLTVLDTPFLTDADSWYLTCEPRLHKLLFYWRQEPVTDHAADFDTKNLKSSMLYRYSHGVADWRGWFGSQGV